MKQSFRSVLQANLRGALLLMGLVGLFIVPTLQAKPVQAESVSGCAAGLHCVFIPMISNPAVNAGDLALNNIEVTQAIQDLNNSVPLVAGRKTMLRVYAQTSGSVPVSNVKVSVSASTYSNTLNGSPKAYSATVPLTYTRTNLSSTLNITLPDAWLNGTIDLTVRLDPDNEIGENNENNNTITKRFVFHPVPALAIKIVPVRYTNTRNGQVYPAPTVDSISDWIMRTYPVSSMNVSMHPAIDFKGDLSTPDGFSNLLDQVTSLKNAENASEAVVYFGLVPISNSNSTWFSAGVAGIGWINSRSAVGLDIPGQASQIAAHEIGHNLGMQHTPCGGAGGTDPNYPYPDGSIGQVGMDVLAGKLYLSTSKDVMSYCTPKWISDYTYKELFNSQSQAVQAQSYSISAGSPAQRGLLVRALISGTGVQLKPAYVLPGPIEATPAPGAYQVEVLGAGGELLGQTSVRAYTADAGMETTVEGIHAVVPLPDQPAAKFRLLKDGKVLAEQNLASTDAPLQSSVVGGSKLHWNTAQADAQQPALVRYSQDGGSTWTILGMDVTDGELPLADNTLPAVAVFQVIPAGVWK